MEDYGGTVVLPRDGSKPGQWFFRGLRSMVCLVLEEAGPAEFPQIRSAKPRAGLPESGPNQKPGISCGDSKYDSWPGKTRLIRIFETDRILVFGRD